MLHQENTVLTHTGAATVAATALVVIVPLLFALPAFASRSLIQNLFSLLTMLTLAQAWNLMAGYAGLVSVGQQAFVGIGGYILFAETIMLGLDPLLSILLAGVVTTILAVPTALVVFRLRGAYLAVGTWVMAEIFRLLFAQWKAVGGGTGTSLPRDSTSSIFGLRFIEGLFGVKTAAARDILNYWLALLLVVAVVALIYRLLRSGRGLALSAVRDSEQAAESLGVDVYRTKIFVYLTASFVTGIAGALIYFQKARISPDAAFSVLDWTAYVVFIVIIGGIGTIEGPIVGVIVFYVLQYYLADFGTWYLIAIGLLSILVMLFAPVGIWGWYSAKYDIHLFPVRRRVVTRGSKQEPNPLLVEVREIRE